MWQRPLKLAVSYAKHFNIFDISRAMWLEFALDSFAILAIGAHEIVVELEAEPEAGRGSEVAADAQVVLTWARLPRPRSWRAIAFAPVQNGYKPSLFFGVSWRRYFSAVFDGSLLSTFVAFRWGDFRQLDPLVGAAFRVFGMRLDGENRDVGLVRPIGPEQAPGTGCVVFKIGLEYLNAVFPAQILDLMRSEAVMPRIRSQVPQRFYEFFEEFLFLLVQPALKTAGREIQPKLIHLGDSHADLKWHKALQPF